jgi:hypothetical protein
VRVSRIPAVLIVTLVTVAVALILASTPARALGPDRGLFAFPSSLAIPAGATSAGVALADRWLGDQPFDNPAFSARRGVELSPVLVDVSRQDLRAANRNYVETGAYLDVAGGWAALPLGRATLFAYGSQPVLNLDDNSFTRGTTAVDPASPPAMIKTQSDAREIRAGAGFAWGDSAFRFGAAGEWTRRDDRYVVDETSGSPLAGKLTTTFADEGFGFQAGVRLARGLSGPHPLTAGLGVRFLPALSASARDLFEPLAPVPADTTDYLVERGSSWEGGLSARYGVNETFSLVAAAGAHGAQSWSGFNATAGTGALWSLAGVFHDPAEAWTFRFGFGHERQHDTAVTGADLIGLGLGWSFEGARLDVGALRRGIHRDDKPTSYDDRVIASLGVSF